MSKMIYHIAEKASWESQKENSVYTHPSLASEGFIHCSEKEQIAGVLNRYFTNATDLLILSIEPGLLKAPLKYELAPIGEVFPHIFGAINKKAIVKIEEL